MLPLHITLKIPAFALLSLTVFTACSSNSKKDTEIIKALNESIENSNTWIERSSNDYMILFEEKVRNAGSRERAQFWYPKAKKIEQLSNDIVNYIETIKKRISFKS